MATLLGGRPCVDPAKFYRECLDRRLPADWWGTANHFALPLGRDPGRGHVLLRLADLDALGTAASHALKFSGTTAANSYTLKQITILGAKCLSPGAEGDAAAVFLAEIADRRHHLLMVPIDAAYNVTAADGSGYLAGTLNAGVAYTWQQVIDALATACGLPAGQFALPFAPDSAPENLTYWGGSAWAALCDVLDRLACSPKFDPAADTFSVVRLGTDTAAADAALAALAPRRTWDGYHVDPARAWRPEKVRTRFLRRPRPTGGTSPYYTVDTTLAAAPGVVAGTFVQLDDDLAALGATGVPSNAAALATRAAERAADWLRRRQFFASPLTEVYRDFLPEVPGGVLGPCVGEVGFDDRGGPMRTEVRADDRGGPEGWKPLSVLPPWFPPDGDDGIHARLTAETVGMFSYQRVGVDASGAQVDIGPPAPVSAAPLGLTGSILDAYHDNQSAWLDQVVWMRPSAHVGSGSGFGVVRQEFVPHVHPTGANGGTDNGYGGFLRIDEKNVWIRTGVCLRFPGPGAYLVTGGVLVGVTRGRLTCGLRTGDPTGGGGLFVPQSMTYFVGEYSKQPVSFVHHVSDGSEGSELLTLWAFLHGNLDPTGYAFVSIHRGGGTGGATLINLEGVTNLDWIRLGPSFRIDTPLDCPAGEAIGSGSGSGSGAPGTGEEYFDLGPCANLSISGVTGNCGCLGGQTTTLRQVSPANWQTTSGADYLDLSGCPNPITGGVGFYWDAGNGWRFYGIGDDLDCEFISQDAGTKTVVVRATSTVVPAGGTCTGSFVVTVVGGACP